jgi:molecular chaperone DnaK (HSP70)
LAWLGLNASDPEAALAQALEADEAGGERPESEFYVGLDLGTSECRFCIFDGHKLDRRVGVGKIPCQVRFEGDSRTIDEDPTPLSVAYGVKRLIGRTLTQDEAAGLGKTFMFPIELDVASRPMIRLRDGDPISPEEVTSIILAEVRHRVGTSIRADPVNAVISVPAFFTNNQRRAVVDAASLAGFKKVQLITDAVALVLSMQRWKQPRATEHTILIVDIGSGHLELSLVKEMGAEFTMLRTLGDTNFGGMEFDSTLFTDLMADPILSTLDESARRRLFFACPTARKRLARTMDATMSVPGISQYVSFTRTIQREQLDVIFRELYAKISDSLDRLFEGCMELKAKVDYIWFAGGMCKVREIVDLIRRYFDRTPYVQFCPDGSAVRGATLHGAILCGLEAEMIPAITIKVSTPQSIGFSSAKGLTKVLIPRGSVLPVVKSVNTTTSRDNQPNVTFDIIEGDAMDAAENIRLGSLTIAEIELAPRAVPKIRVTMMIDESGLLTVKAMDARTRAVMSTTLQSGINLSEAEMEVARSMNRADEKRIRKRDVWKARLIQYFEALKRTTVMDPKQRIEFHKVKHALQEWISAHRSEETADPYIKKYFEVREEVIPFRSAAASAFPD